MNAALAGTDPVVFPLMLSALAPTSVATNVPFRKLVNVAPPTTFTFPLT